jgi:antirestriction protein
MSNQAFYYVDGIPTKGAWVDLDIIGDESNVLEDLACAGKIPRDEDGEPSYGGDLLVADVEGDLARAFLSKYGTFDLDGFIEARDYCDGEGDKEGAVAAFIAWYGSWDKDNFEEAYSGCFENEVQFAEQLVDDLGYLDQIPENLRYYFDYEKFARDLFINDYYFVDGYVFNRNV